MADIGPVVVTDAKANFASATVVTKQDALSLDSKLVSSGTKEMNYATGPISGGTDRNNEDPTKTKDDQVDYDFVLRLPAWGYQDFIAERASFVKGFDSPSGDPGWFYFKIFFRFDTQNGLFGGLLNEENQQGEPLNVNYGLGDCAYKYLKMNEGHYTKAHMENRARTLVQFAKTLSFINSKAPWFFDSIGGLDKASVVDFNKPLEDRFIELGFREDAVDMRVTSLIDLYKYACFDYMNLKEVVPQNLRQFDMIIVLFHTPLRWYHTGMQTMRRGTFQYKSIDGANNDWNECMSYKMYTFKGCEFMHETLGSVYPSEMTNDNASSLAKSKIQISYKRCYQHTLNEWSRFMIGDDGIYWEDTKGTSKRFLAMQDAASNPYYYNPGADIFKALVDASEAKINYAMRQVLPETQFGNLYLDYTDPYGEYAQTKLNMLKEGTEPGEMGRMMAAELNDQGLFRNIDNARDNVGRAISRVTRGNFF